MEETEKQFYSLSETLWTKIVERDNENIKQLIRDYAMERSAILGERITVRFLDKETVDEIIELGTQEYLRRHNNKRLTMEDYEDLVEAVYLHNSNIKNTVCCIEEMSELTKVLTKFLRESPKFNKADLTEELSHVLLLCDVMIRQHGIDRNDILEHQRKAVDRMYENK